MPVGGRLVALFLSPTRPVPMEIPLGPFQSRRKTARDLLRETGLHTRTVPIATPRQFEVQDGESVRKLSNDEREQLLQTRGVLIAKKSEASDELGLLEGDVIVGRRPSYMRGDRPVEYVVSTPTEERPSGDGTETLMSSVWNAFQFEDGPLPENYTMQFYVLRAGVLHLTQPRPVSLEHGYWARLLDATRQASIQNLPPGFED